MIWWNWTISFFSSVGLCKSSSSITRGKSCLEEVAKVARESKCVFLLLGICCKVKNSKLDYKRQACFKYPYILKSLASNSSFTWPTTSLESENTFIDFPPIFWTMAIPTSKVSYSASLFVIEKPNLKDFSIMILFRDIITNPTLDPLWLDAPSTYNFQDGVPCKETVPTYFPLKSCSSSSSFIGDSANSATKSVRTCPLIKVRAMYLMSKAPKIVPHLTILPI